jgi:hypothetical protein
MDLNELLYHHQVALIRAAQVPLRCTQSAFDLVRHYETRLAHHRLELGVVGYPRWSAGSRLAAS